MHTKTNHRIYMPFLSKSLLIAGVCVIPLVTPAPSSAQTGTWRNGNASSCIIVCQQAGSVAALSGTFQGVSYAVCRYRQTNPSWVRRRPGFNIQLGPSADRCRTAAVSATNNYDCLCL